VSQGPAPAEGAPAGSGDRGRDEVHPALVRAAAAHDFDEIYRTTTPPWDIGRPQGAFVRLADAGVLGARVLDAGCGTGEHALLAAAHGSAAVGVDASPTAIERARAKAAARGLDVRFVVGDALDLGALGERFDTVLDCGLFHTFDDDDRARYVASLGAALVEGGRCHVLCFSDAQPGDWGPRRVRREELEAAFASGWRLESVEPTELELIEGMGTARAWLATAVRAGAWQT